MPETFNQIFSGRLYKGKIFAGEPFALSIRLVNDVNLTIQPEDVNAFTGTIPVYDALNNNLQVVANMNVSIIDEFIVFSLLGNQTQNLPKVVYSLYQIPQLHTLKIAITVL